MVYRALMSFLQDFKAFAVKGNVVDLAVAVVIGAAFGKIVTAVVEDIVMPILGFALPQGDWRNATFTPLHFKLGHLAGAVLDFFTVALIVFILVFRVMKMLKLYAPPPPPATRPCPECCEAIAIAAKRCKFCTATVPEWIPPPPVLIA